MHRGYYVSVVRDHVRCSVLCRVYRNGRILTMTEEHDEPTAVREARRMVRIARQSGF